MTSVEMHTMQVEEMEEGELDDGVDICQGILVGFCILLIIVTFPFTIWGTIKIVSQYERAVAFRLGKLRPGPARPAGIYLIIPCLDEYRIIDMRTKSFDVPPQEILTKDGVSAAVDAVVFFRVANATTMVTKAENAEEATMLSAQTTLRNILGTKTLSEILAEKEEMAHEMLIEVDIATDEWGVKVERVEIRDVRLPFDMQRTMASEAEASRKAKAKVIHAEGETNASKKLKEASDVMSDSPHAIKLRYLQTLNTISAKDNHTIIIPFQEDVVKHFLEKIFL